MGTKKNGKKNNNNKGVAQKWIDVPLAAWVMDLGAYAIPIASVAELVVTARLLADRQRVDPTVGEQQTKARMTGAADLCARAIEHNAMLLSVPAADGNKRRRLVTQVTSMMEMVAVRARSPEPDIAEDATRLQATVFGAELDPVRMDARTLILKVDGMGMRLAQEPDLRKRLEACVPKTQLDRLFAEAQQWGKETPADAEKVPALDLRTLRAHLRQRMAEYVTNVLATVNGDDPGTTARATKALMPLTELREDVRLRYARRARKKGAGVEVEVAGDEGDELEPVVADDEDGVVAAQPVPPPAATPAVTPVTDDDG